jgi:hypothetical protein
VRIVECTVWQLMLNEQFVESAGTLCIGGRHRSRASNDALVVASFEGGGGLEGVSGRGKASRAGAGLRTTPTTLKLVLVKTTLQQCRGRKKAQAQETSAGAAPPAKKPALD